MKQRNYKALVLNADFLPLGTISWQRAIVLSLDDENDRIKVVEYYDDFILDTNFKKYPIPAVIHLINFVKRKITIPFSRKNVFIRDNMRCQYCGQHFHASTLTYDHVIPKKQWKITNGDETPTCWANIVTACIKCNRHKANRTPEEANMVLLQRPRKPNPYGYILGISPWTKIPKEWKNYLTILYKNLSNR